MSKQCLKTVYAILQCFLTSDVIKIHRRRHKVVKTVCACWIERTKTHTHTHVAPAIYKQNVFGPVPLQGILILLTESQLKQLCSVRQSQIQFHN